MQQRQIAGAWIHPFRSPWKNIEDEVRELGFSLARILLASSLPEDAELFLNRRRTAGIAERVEPSHSRAGARWARKGTGQRRSTSTPRRKACTLAEAFLPSMPLVIMQRQECL